jgi:hypothetical protein
MLFAMNNYLDGTALLVGYADPLLGADVSPRWSKDASARRYEALKRLPVSELKARADRVIDSLKSWQSTIFSDANGRAYRAALDQAVWQKSNGDSASSDADKRLAYARCVHMGEDALLQFTSMGPGDSYFDTFLESAKQLRDAVKGAPGTLFESVTGMSRWVLYLGGAAVVGSVVYGGYQIVKAAAPGVSAELTRKLVLV